VGEGELLLVLDDVDELANDESAGQFLSTLCLQAPSRLHIVLSGREPPSFGLGLARGRGELIELDASDLAFTSEEVASLLAERLGSGAESLAEQCWSLTAGWAAALQLIADRLERLDPSRWHRALEQLRLHRGAVWREFAADLIDREAADAQRILAVASVAPAVDGELLASLGIAVTELELDGLQARGLLVASGEHGARRLSPVLADAVTERLEAEELRRQIIASLEQSDRLDEALECAVGGSREQALSLLERCGERLIERGYGLRVAEVIRDLDALGRDRRLGRRNGGVRSDPARGGGGPAGPGGRLALRGTALSAL
jgi:ATP/maltotriose-dependent transcriptional regulator MalT